MLPSTIDKRRGHPPKILHAVKKNVEEGVPPPIDHGYPSLEMCLLLSLHENMGLLT